MHVVRIFLIVVFIFFPTYLFSENGHAKKNADHTPPRPDPQESFRKEIQKNQHQQQQKNTDIPNKIQNRQTQNHSPATTIKKDIDSSASIQKVFKKQMDNLKKQSQIEPKQLNQINNELKKLLSLIQENKKYFEKYDMDLFSFQFKKISQAQKKIEIIRIKALQKSYNEVKDLYNLLRDSYDQCEVIKRQFRAMEWILLNS